jgi:hypothetical protein
MMGIRLRNEIAQLQLSDFWRGIHALRKFLSFINRSRAGMAPAKSDRYHPKFYALRRGWVPYPR